MDGQPAASMYPVYQTPTAQVKPSHDPVRHATITNYYESPTHYKSELVEQSPTHHTIYPIHLQAHSNSSSQHGTPQQGGKQHRSLVSKAQHQRHPSQRAPLIPPSPSSMLVTHGGSATSSKSITSNLYDRRKKSLEADAPNNRHAWNDYSHNSGNETEQRIHPGQQYLSPTKLTPSSAGKMAEALKSMKSSMAAKVQPDQRSGNVVYTDDYQVDHHGRYYAHTQPLTSEMLRQPPSHPTTYNTVQMENEPPAQFHYNMHSPPHNRTASLSSISERNTHIGPPPPYVQHARPHHHVKHHSDSSVQHAGQHYRSYHNGAAPQQPYNSNGEMRLRLRPRAISTEQYMVGAAHQPNAVEYYTADSAPPVVSTSHSLNTTPVKQPFSRHSTDSKQRLHRQPSYSTATTPYITTPSFLDHSSDANPRRASFPTPNSDADHLGFRGQSSPAMMTPAAHRQFSLDTSPTIMSSAGTPLSRRSSGTPMESLRLLKSRMRSGSSTPHPTLQYSRLRGEPVSARSSAGSDELFSPYSAPPTLTDRMRRHSARAESTASYLTNSYYPSSVSTSTSSPAFQTQITPPHFRRATSLAAPQSHYQHQQHNACYPAPVSAGHSVHHSVSLPHRHATPQTVIERRHSSTSSQRRQVVTYQSPLQAVSSSMNDSLLQSHRSVSDSQVPAILEQYGHAMQLQGVETAEDSPQHAEQMYRVARRSHRRATQPANSVGQSIELRRCATPPLHVLRGHQRRRSDVSHSSSSVAAMMQSRDRSRSSTAHSTLGSDESTTSSTSQLLTHTKPSYEMEPAGSDSPVTGSSALARSSSVPTALLSTVIGPSTDIISTLHVIEPTIVLQNDVNQWKLNDDDEQSADLAVLVDVSTLPEVLQAETVVDDVPIVALSEETLDDEATPQTFNRFGLKLQLDHDSDDSNTHSGVQPAIKSGWTDGSTVVDDYLAAADAAAEESAPARPAFPALTLSLDADGSEGDSFGGGADVSSEDYYAAQQPKKGSLARKTPSAAASKPSAGKSAINTAASKPSGAFGKHRPQISYDITANGNLRLDGGYEITEAGVVNVPFHATLRGAQMMQATGSSVLHAPDYSMPVHVVDEAVKAVSPSAATTATASVASSSPLYDPETPAPSSAATSNGKTSPHSALHHNLNHRSTSQPSNLPPLPRHVAVAQQPAPMLSSPPSLFNARRARQSSLGVPIRMTDLKKLGELGRGATGPVIKALYLPTLTIVALKSVRVDNKDERHQLVKELKAFHVCQNAHILSFIGACFADGKLTMVLEYLNRGSLDQVIKRHGRLDEMTIRTIALQTLRGLQHLHSKKTVHRDIKPANLLVNSSGVCKISDFGLLKQLDNTNAMCSTFVGTLMYLSPERVTGDHFSYPSDIWSFGLALIYCARGSLPIPKDYWAILTMINKQGDQTVRDSPFALDTSEFSAEFCEFVALCMERDPTQRSTATQLLLHPFVSPPAGSLAAEQALKHVTPYAAMTLEESVDMEELELLVDAIIEYYYADVTVWKGTHQDHVRIKHIAEQMGCSASIVEQALVRQFNKAKNGGDQSEESGSAAVTAGSSILADAAATPAVTTEETESDDEDEVAAELVDSSNASSSISTPRLRFHSDASDTHETVIDQLLAPDRPKGSSDKPHVAQWDGQVPNNNFDEFKHI